MLNARWPKTTVSPLRAFLWALAVSAALVFVLIPGGEAPLAADDVAAAVLVALVGGASLALYLYLFQPQGVSDLGRLAMVALLVILWVLAAKVFLSLTLPDNDRLFLGYMLPVAAAPMLVATLLDGSLALAVALIVVVLATFAGFYNQDLPEVDATSPLSAFPMATVFIFGGLTGIYAIFRAERMQRYLVAGGMVALVSFSLLLAFWLVDSDRRGQDVPLMLLATGIGGILSAVVTVGASVVLGLLFGISTRVQLMELAQLSHPLLRRLQEEAPGTFHHSVVVGNLAERAADLVKADSLLVRVGCYFHDIGKVAQPEYYIENQLTGDNPHDRMTPQASATVVSHHVRAGLELARKHRLPALVRAFVGEHHGTRLVTYFYRKASAQDPTADPEKFRYPGPRPRSKETAIVMLADSVEAVVRSSRDRSTERIDALVDGVVAERVTEGQLDQCDLTLRDLRVIAESFKATLHGIYHPRIEYPAPTAAEARAATARTFLQPPPGPVDGTAPPLEVERPSS
jgi:putative nucleotidyltransferase with HDIG domain